MLEEYLLHGTSSLGNILGSRRRYTRGSIDMINIIINVGTGPEHFARSVATVEPSLHELRRAYPTVNGAFIHRLTFAVRYAEFHRQRLNGDLQEAALDLVALFQEEIAPRGWWGVLLLDATELLKIGKRELLSRCLMLGPTWLLSVLWTEKLFSPLSYLFCLP